MSKDYSRLKRIPVTMALLQEVFLTGQTLRAEVVQGIPAGSTIVRHAYDHATGFYWITIHNDSFEQVKQGKEIPALPIVCKNLPSADEDYKRGYDAGYQAGINFVATGEAVSA